MKMPSGHKLLSEISPDLEEFPRKRGSDGEETVEAGAAQKKAREVRTRAGAERASTSYGEPSRGEQRRAEEESNRGAKEGEIRKDMFPGNERPATSGQLQQEEEEGREQTPAFDAEAAVKKLAQTKEHFAELCRKYLASYKTQGADVIYQLACSRFTAKRPEENVRERNAAGGTTASVSAAHRPPSNDQQPPPEYFVLSDSDTERNDERPAARPHSFSAACPPSQTYQPPPECRRMPSDVDGFLKSDVLQLEYHPSNASYREELLLLESRTLKMLDSFHQSEQVEKETGGRECDGTSLCKARVNESDTSAISHFRSYQFAFKAAAIAEIVRLKSNLIKSKMEVAGLLCDDTLSKGFSGGRPQFELVKRLKLENESAASELAQLRAEKKVSDESFAEIQGAMQYLQNQISSCTCEHVFPGKRIGGRTRETLDLSPTVDDMQQQHRRHNGHDIASRVKPIRGYHTSVSAEDERALERICEDSVEQEVAKLVDEKLDAVKADMGVFVKTLKSRVADVAGKINENECRVGPVKVGLFCLRLLIKKLEAKKAEIEASLVENSSDNRLGLKLHFRS